MNQTRWSKGDASDLEDEHDGREPDVDDEDGGDDEWELGWTYLQTRSGTYSVNPWWAVADGECSLGSTTSINQLRWASGRNDDTEEQCEDEGAIDADLEPDHEDGFGMEAVFHHYCSPVSTLLGGGHAK